MSRKYRKLYSAKPDDRCRVLEAATEAADRDVAEAVREVLAKETVGKVISAAARYFQAVPDPSAVPALIKHAHRTDGLRAEPLAALVHIGTEQALAHVALRFESCLVFTIFGS